MSADEYTKPYPGKNSYGETYGKHREALELTDNEHHGLFLTARAYGLDFIETVCSSGALSILKLFTPDYLKIASRDLNNIPLLEAVAETNIPVIMSTGMSEIDEIRNAYRILRKNNVDVSILHCVSQYPAAYKNLNLVRILQLQNKFPGVNIGYSDHTAGILAPSIAVAMGAEIIEKHITLDREFQGSDHAGSLSQEGFTRFIRDIRNTEQSIGKLYIGDETDIPVEVRPFQKKLRRSLAVKHEVKKGETITASNLIMISPGGGHEWLTRKFFIGEKAKEYIPALTILHGGMV